MTREQVAGGRSRRAGPRLRIPSTTLEARRLELKYTQDEVGRAVGLSGRGVGFVESGQGNPPQTVRNLLAQLYKVSRATIDLWIDEARSARSATDGGAAA